MFGLAPLPRTLAAALRDAASDKERVRLSAVRDLARHAAAGAAEAFERLTVILADDAAPAVRAEAALALADAGQGKAVGALARAAESDDGIAVRQMALVALGELAVPDDADAARVVARALEDRRPELRFQALIAHCRLAGASALPALHEAFSDRDSLVRALAFRLAEEAALAAEPSGLPRELGQAATAALEDAEARVRLAAALLLARFGDRTGASVIVDAIATGSGVEQAEDAQACMELAAALGLEEARAPLGRRAFGLFGQRHDDLAWHARVALAQLGDERAKRAILNGLDAWTGEARTLAVAAAGRARIVEARERIAAMQGRPDRAAGSAVEEALALLDGGPASTD